MSSRCKRQLDLFRGGSQASLLPPFLARHPFEVSGPYLPGKLLLEGKGTPGGPRFDLLGPQAQQQPRGHEGDSNRALPPRHVLRDLMLAQAHHSLQFFHTQFDRPSAQIHGHGRVSCSLRQIGHQQLGLLGAVVTPPPTAHYGDISDLPQLRTLGKGPEDPASGAGDEQGDTDLAVVVNRQMGDHIAQVLTVGQLPGAWQGDHKEPLAGLNGRQIGPRGIGGIRHHEDVLNPSGQHPILKHLPQEGILRLIAWTPLRLDHAEGQRHAVDVPLRKENAHVQAKGIGGILVEPPLLGQGILLRTFAFEGAVHHQIEDAIAWGREGAQSLADQPLQYPRPLPAPGRQHPAQVPGGAVRGEIPGQALQRGFLKTHQVSHQQPTKDQVGTVTEIGLEGSQQTRYFLRQPGHPDHGWPRRWTSKMAFIPPSPYRLPGPPATAPFVRLQCCRTLKRQHNHIGVHLNLSSLSTYAITCSTQWSAPWLGSGPTLRRTPSPRWSRSCGTSAPPSKGTLRNRGGAPSPLGRQMPWTRSAATALRRPGGGLHCRRARSAATLGRRNAPRSRRSSPPTRTEQS